MKYFDKYPLISYNGITAKNILLKVDITDKTKKDIYSTFDYTLKEGQSRADVLSNAYYGSPYYDWLVFLMNGIVDPYYGVFLTDPELEAFIISKYGSIENSQSKILFYRNNWSPDESTISISSYGLLDPSIQRYYKPNINQDNVVLSYSRHQEDWTVSTNQIVSLNLSSVSSYSIGDKYTQGNTYGFIASIDATNNIINVQHVSGTFVIDSNISAVKILVSNIPTSEAAFWAPVTAYENEVEKNELKKYITMVKNTYLPDIDNQFNTLINQ